MGSLKQEQKVECEQEFNKDVSEDLQVAIDDDDKVALNVARSESEVIGKVIAKSEV